jgi:hypothetical protein
VIPNVQDLSIAGGLLAGLLVALEAGFRMRRRAAVEGDADRGAQIGSIQGAILGLLGLLLAFSFAGAGTRFLERQDLIVEEANAIGTSYLRADLLDEPHRSALRAALKGYTEHRIRISRDLRDGLQPDEVAEIDRLHARIWSAASAGVAARPTSMLGVLPPVNEVIDLHATRVAAARKHLPLLVMGLLVACSLLASGVMGYGCGLGGRRRAPLTVPLAILIGTALWVTIDLDHPRAGLMRLSDAPLEVLRFDPLPEP